MSLFLDQTFWKNRLAGELPGRKSHEAFYPLRQKELTEIDVTNYRKAAVGIHLFPRNGKCCFLVIERAEYDGTHSKQMAFPGGKVDLTDENTIHTARRESFEEVGIPQEKGKFLGSLTTVHIPVSSFSVDPHLFFHEELLVLIPDEREVHAYYLFDLEDLLEPTNCKEVDIPINARTTMKRVPCFELKGKIIWGATAIILSELKDLIHFR